MKNDAAKRLILGASRGIETTLDELCLALDFSDQYQLERAVRIEEFLVEWNFQLSPGVREHMTDFKLVRLLQQLSLAGECSTKVEQELAEGEAQKIERKSSLFFDRNKYQGNSQLDINDYKSKEVAHSSLKTIAGFLNAEGGILYIGVFDDHSIAGLEADFPYVKGKDIDTWQLALQDLVKKKFKDGDAILAYCLVQIIERGCKCIARVEVLPRREPVFLFSEKKNQYCFYARNGNETNEIGIEHFQEYLNRKVS